MHKCDLMEKESGIMNKLKKDKKITYKMISVCLSLVMMITSFLPMTVQAADKNEIINSLSDIPAILEDKDTQALGSGKIYYRKADVDIADGTNTSNYQKALQTSFQDDQYKMNTSTSSLVNDWEYLGACLFERARANDTPTKYIKNLTVYGKKDLPEGMVDKYRFLVPNIFEGTDNSLKNAQKKAIDQINNYEVMDGKKMQAFVTAKEASQLSNSNEEGPVYYKTILLPVLDPFLTVQFRAMTVYFHNFKVSPIYPMNEGSYHREISDEQEKSPMYTAGYNNDSGTTVSGTQSLTNAVNYTVTNAVNGSKSYTYEESVSVEYKKALGVFGEITGTIGFNTSQAIENGDITLSGGKGAQKVTAQKEGTYYLTYFIDEDQYHTITNMNHYATNQTVTRPTVKFTVEKVPVNNNTSDTKKDDQTNNTGRNDQQIKNITISAISDKIAPGKKIKLTTNLPKDKVKWMTNNSKLATVDKNGVIKINKKAAGKKVIITAIATDGSGKKKTFVIRVMKGEVKKITIKGKKSVKAGKTVKLKAVVKASKGANKKLRWTSNNTKYATVTSSGKVKTKKAGKKKTIKITAMAIDGSNKKATIKIKLK